MPNSSDHQSDAATHSSASGPTRRELLQGSLAVAGAAVASSIAPSILQAQPAAKRPNLVFFLGEGQRADALSIAGNPILKTPNHDRIGREGVRFQNAFCTNALCAPARAVALSGMYSRSTGALSNHVKDPLPADIPLFTDILRDAGYEIAIVGKVHGRNGFEERHWDYYFGHNAPANNYNDPFFKEGRNGQVGPQQQFHNVYPDDLAVDRALAWLEEDRGAKPFCLLVWFVAPHEPFFRPRRHLDLYRNGTIIPKPATFDDDLKGYPGKPKGFADATNKIGTTFSHPACGSLEGVAKDYYAGLVAVDENIGRILSYLEKKNILDDTAIVQTSDHGFFLGEWRMFDKRLMHEPSIRVPFQARYPRRIPAGTVRNEMVLDIDLAPTFLDLAGLPAPAHMQGKSVLPLAHASDPSFRPEWYYEYFEWPNPETVPPCRGIRTDRYKLIHYTPEAEAFELYDLQVDPKETLNLYGDPAYAAVQQHLIERLDALRAAVPELKDGTQA
jgi:arylsulfatase A-like enzyme